MISCDAAKPQDTRKKTTKKATACRGRTRLSASPLMRSRMAGFVLLDGDDGAVSGGAAAPLLSDATASSGRCMGRRAHPRAAFRSPPRDDAAVRAAPTQ